MTRLQRLVEILLILAVFALQGANPVPDVNEQNYLGKAVHYWNPQWAKGDFFLETPDAHLVFYLSFGWLSLLVSPPVMAWAGRLLVWTLMAWSWQRLSSTVLPVRWWSILTAALLACLVDRCHVAGEWIIGGVEAKGFAFVLMFLALEAILHNRWGRAWLLLGGATMFHPLVGGWSAVAAAIVWLWDRADGPSLRQMLPAMFGGLVIALPGLVPVLLLNRGADAATTSQANVIYVFYRLYHHLDPLSFQPPFVVRFVLLGLLWLALCELLRAEADLRRLRLFVAAAISIAIVGAAAALIQFVDRPLAAAVLRFYWFRLADVAVPLGVALVGPCAVRRIAQEHPGRAAGWLTIVICLLLVHFVPLAYQRLQPGPPRADRLPDYQAWRDVCAWIAANDQIPSEAIWLTPRANQTFKWYTGRPEVVTWKELPQDAAGICQWWQRLGDIYGYDSEPGKLLHSLLSSVPPEQLLAAARKYNASFLLADRKSDLPLKRLYENRSYAVYDLREPLAGQSGRP